MRSTALYVTGGVGTVLFKYGPGSTEWCTVPSGTSSTVDVANITGLGTAALVDTGTDAGNVPTIAQADARYAAASHTHAQSDITNLTTDLAAKAPIASPALTGTPTAPTAAAGANTTQIATTAFVAASYAGRALALPFALP